MKSEEHSTHSQVDLELRHPHSNKPVMYMLIEVEMEQPHCSVVPSLQNTLLEVHLEQILEVMESSSIQALAPAVHKLTSLLVAFSYSAGQVFPVQDHSLKLVVSR